MNTYQQLHGMVRLIGIRYGEFSQVAEHLREVVKMDVNNGSVSILEFKVGSSYDCRRIKWGTTQEVIMVMMRFRY
jgi:hypothetical protein